MLDILYMWLLASVVCGLWPFFLLLIGIERPGLVVAIAPALVIVLAVFSIPLLAMKCIQLAIETLNPPPRKIVRV